MTRNIYGLIIFLFVFGICQQMKANQKKEKSYEITKYELVKTENLALLKFALKPIVEGDIHYFIHALKEEDVSTMVKRFSILRNGNVGIGVSNPQEKLVVDGTICAKEVRVSLSGSPCWPESPDLPDYVFDENYKLRDLSELESSIKSNKHLPDIPTAHDVRNNGLELGDMQARMMQKIEEMTLYIIELKKENEEIKKIISNKKE